MTRKTKSDKLFDKLDNAVEKLAKKYGISENTLYDLTDLARAATRAQIAEELSR